MKIIRGRWLELIFAVLISSTIIASASGRVKDIPIESGRRLEPSNQKISTNDLLEYLRTIEHLYDCTVIICVKDIQGYPMPENALKELERMGFASTEALSEKVYHSFIGIWSKGEVVYEKMGGDELIEHGQYFHDHYIFVQSATFNAGNIGKIYVDNIQYSMERRGLNIVVIDNTKFELIDSINFDTFEAGAPASRHR